MPLLQSGANKQRQGSFCIRRNYVPAFDAEFLFTECNLYSREKEGRAVDVSFQTFLIIIAVQLRTVNTLTVFAYLTTDEINPVFALNCVC